MTHVHADSGHLFVKKKLKHKVDIKQIIKDKASFIWEKTPKRMAELQVLEDSKESVEEQLDIFNIRDEIGKLKACMAVLLTKQRDKDKLVEDANRVFLHAHTVWNKSDFV